MQISPDAKGILVGVGAAILIIAVEIVIDRVALDALISGVIGAIVGLVSAQLLSWVFYRVDPRLYELSEKYALLMHVVLAYLGLVIFVRKRQELELLDRDLLMKGSKKKLQNIHIVDTSVLIDGRVADVCESKFLSGTLVVPRFVLKELQNIADSADNARRSRGRRGMEILARLQEIQDVPVKIFDKDFSDIKEVDSKLVALARELGAKILTTDFNLNKIASIQGVTVLNINDLANALKPVVLPGEAMTVFVVKEGKERDQGIGYLDDGTMVVVEDGRKAIGQKLSVTVTSILQTSAGRMVFTKSRERVHELPREPHEPHEPHEPPANDQPAEG
ncbi:MAG: PIN domain-containing protein [Elusimicrobia bacterium]|nr:PIN domain-containing protein [Elusimicrobiota bacterium]